MPREKRYQAMFFDWHTALYDSKRKKRVDYLLPKKIREMGLYNRDDTVWRSFWTPTRRKKYVRGYGSKRYKRK